MKKYMIENFDEIDPVQCPCGSTKRAFISPDNPVATIHMVDIKADSEVHYHAGRSWSGQKGKLRWFHQAA